MFRKLGEAMYHWFGRLLYAPGQCGDARFFRLCQPSHELVEMAIVHVEVMRQHGHMSCEMKRDRCYKLLVRQFPHEPKSNISVAIEIAYQCG